VQRLPKVLVPLIKGQKYCGLSTIGCTSFFPSKPLGCYGDGGACFTNDYNLAQIMQEIRVHGQDRIGKTVHFNKNKIKIK